MEPLEIRKYPDIILREQSVKLDKITKVEIELFKKMLFTMRYFSGIGLAGPQVGINKCLIVANIGEGPIRLANPVILNRKGLSQMEEGCLSLPGVGVTIDRPDQIIVRGLDENNKIIELEAVGLLARVLQHEIDHLAGKLIIDYFSAQKRSERA
jgi:peptide deformylase